MALNGEVEQCMIMTNEIINLLREDGKLHSLLEPPVPAYTDMTLRRAYIVWVRCGKVNEFKHVAAYFHRLEALEEELPMEERVRSRLLEYNLMTLQPPTSTFLNTYFPNLYQQPMTNKAEPPTKNKFKDYVFDLEGYCNLHMDQGMTPSKMLEASHIIKNYCREHTKSLKWLLAEFQNFTKICNVANSVNNIVMYIMKKLLQDEIQLNANIPKNFNFLDTIESTNKTDLNKNSVNHPKKNSDVINCHNMVTKNYGNPNTREIQDTKKEMEEDIEKIMKEEIKHLKENMKEEEKENINKDLKEGVEEDIKEEIKEEIKQDDEEGGLDTMKDSKENIKEEKKMDTGKDLKEEKEEDIKEAMREEIKSGVKEKTLEENQKDSKALLEYQNKNYILTNYISWQIASSQKSESKSGLRLDSFIIYGYLK